MSSGIRHGARGMWLALAFAVLSTTSSVFATPLLAARGTPVVDGAIDDDVWSTAPWSDDFRQRTPQPGGTAAHRTRARVLYDDRAIYVAIDCETGTRPEARRARRDEIPTGEWARVMIDTRGEGVTAYAFTTTPGGAVSDAIAQGDEDFDTAWDAVWSVEPRVHDHGWTVEYAIPWRVLRFDSAHPMMRIQFERYDFQEGQTLALVPLPPDSPRYVARFAQLQGVGGIATRRLAEFVPYSLARFRLAIDPDRLDPTPLFSANVGGDLKLGITNDLVLDATLNPDFGQVEVDPAVVNLSTYEVFFPERRPFFLEGTDLFRTPVRLLHTRRIGAAPTVPDPLHGGTITAVTPVAPIWAAAKVAGRVGSLSFLLLDGVTGPANAVESYDVGRQALIEAAPPTNWLAARVRTPFGSGSLLGAMFTHVARIGSPNHNDTVGAVDWDLRAPDNLHRFRGQVIGTQAWNPTDGVHNGAGMFLEFARAEDPFWVWTFRTRVFSRDFDPNGAGYNERPNQVSMFLDMYFRTPRPVGVFRTAYINPWIWRTTNVDNLVIDQGGGIEVGVTGRSQWSIGVGGLVWTPREDDRETRGGIPWHNETDGEAWAWLSTDPRVRVRGGLSADVSTRAGGHRGSATAWVTWTPVPFVTLNLTATGRTVVNMPRWVENVTDTAGAMHSIFGQQRAQIVECSLRAGAAITRRLSVDLFTQLLAAALRYEQFTELVRSDRLVPTSYAGQPDYDRVSLTINAIGRYEYLPGSFVTLVLQHRSALTASPGDPGFDSGLSLFRDSRPDTLLLLKLTYLWM